MKTKTETFASLMEEFRRTYELRRVFDDFLTMTLCAYSRNPATGLSHDEDLYLQTIDRYRDDPLRFHFPKLVALLTMEMEERIEAGKNSDVLGEFYERHFCRKDLDQYFTPWDVCNLLAQISSFHTDSPEPLRVLDTSCGSGRSLLAASRVNGTRHHYYGADIDPMCVKMAAITLFSHGVFGSEVMCADALVPEDFRESYVLSMRPFGIFRITERERSPLWNMLRHSLEKDLKLQERIRMRREGGIQATLF